ncbi:MAG: Spy/CpxP family protein refolding chaperone [Ignavibacterium sp.]|jgi:Spy/CpxP family protein refolding chaperone|nr:Spy/CpxP family protein refolding chaperone [Ignavibacterium sp.]
MKKFLIPLVALLVIIGLNKDIFAQRDQYKGRQYQRENNLEKLNLTTEQKSKIESMRLSNQEEMVKLRAELELKELEMKKLKTAEKFSRNDVLNLTKEINEIKGKIELARTNHRMDVYDILDANQKKIWIEMDRNPGFMKNKVNRKLMHQRMMTD